MTGLFGAEPASPYLPPSQTQPSHASVGRNVLTMLDLLTGGYGHAVMAMQRQGEARQQAQALAGIQSQDYGDAASMFRPQSVTAAPAAPVPDASSGVNLFAGGKYGPAPTQTFGGDSASVSPAQIPSFEQFAPIAARMASHGADPSAFMNIIKSAEPDIQFVNGVAVDRRATKPGSRVGVNLSNVNNRMVDTQNPDNANLTVPQVDKGQVVNYDPRGVPIGVSNLPGNVQAQADVAGGIAGAQARSQAPYQFEDIPTPGGAPGKAARSAIAGGVFTGQTPGDKAYSEDQAKAQAAQYQNLQNSGQQAPLKIAKLQQIDKLLGDFEGGKFAASKVGFASALNSLGVKVDPKLGDEQAAQALSNQMALELRDPSAGGGMPGSMSNSDREFLTRMVPGLAQSAAGRRQLVQMNVAVQQRNADVASKARAWTKSNGRLDRPDVHGKDFYDYLGDYSNQNPVFK
jgi:hypothetical protein